MLQKNGCYKSNAKTTLFFSEIVQKKNNLHQIPFSRLFWKRKPTPLFIKVYCFLTILSRSPGFTLVSFSPFQRTISSIVTLY